MADDPSYPIGFGKPPVSRRFGQPGGNPRGKGRTKGARNVATILEEVLSERITVKGGAKGERKISKLDASLTQLANKAATGDLKAIQLVIALWQGLEARRQTEAPPQLQLTDADLRVLNLLNARVQRAAEEDDHG